MSKVLWMAALCAVTLASCGRSAPRQPVTDEKTDAQIVRQPSLYAPPPAYARAAAERAASGNTNLPPAVIRPSARGALLPTPDMAAPTAPMPPAAPMLAYAYHLGLTMPAGSVRSTMERHQKACEDAGPLVCQVTAAEAQTEGSDIAHAQLDLRATPAWLKTFREGLENDTKRLGGHVNSTSTSTEDLTRSIIDTEAANRARIVLRDRLERLLAERPGDLSEVMQLQQQIAQVQGQIDGSQSELEVMRARVAMSQLTLNYTAEGVVAPRGVETPLSQAGRSFLWNMLSVLGVMVTLLSFLLPLIIIGGPILWLVMRYRKRAKRPTSPPVA